MMINCKRKFLSESAKRFCGRMALRSRTVEIGERLTYVHAVMS